MRILILLLLLACPAVAADECLGVDPQASTPLSEATKTQDCHVRMSPTGYPLPDPDCTPGAVNPTVNANVLRNPSFRTNCVRDGATTAAEKRSVYAAYGITPPKKNSGKSQTCEIDHLVSIELGGADTLDNLWPQCAPRGVALKRRWFKVKDLVENSLAKQIKTESEEPEGLQRGIAEDWSQYVTAATAAAPKARHARH
jgi:hypothetical protein